MVASPLTSFGVRSSRIHLSRMRDVRTSKDVGGEAIPLLNEPQAWHGKIQCTNRVLQVIKKNVGNRLIQPTKRGKSYTNVFNLRKQPTFSNPSEQTRQDKKRQISFPLLFSEPVIDQILFVPWRSMFTRAFQVVLQNKCSFFRTKMNFPRCFQPLVKATISSGLWNMLWLGGALREDKYGRALQQH